MEGRQRCPHCFRKLPAKIGEATPSPREVPALPSVFSKGHRVKAVVSGKGRRNSFHGFSESLLHLTAAIWRLWRLTSAGGLVTANPCPRSSMETAADPLLCFSICTLKQEPLKRGHARQERHQGWLWTAPLKPLLFGSGKGRAKVVLLVHCHCHCSTSDPRLSGH